MTGVTESDRNRGKVLAAGRAAAKLTQDDVAERLKKTQTWVSRVESGELPPSRDELNELNTLYQINTLVEFKTSTGKLSGSRLDRKLIDLRQLERTASEVSVLISERIPMSLQAERYTVEQYRRAGYSTSEADIAEVRLSWQRVLTNANAPLYKVVLSESALYRMPGGFMELVREQAAHLLDLVERFPKLRLRVLPFTADVAFIDADMVIIKSAATSPSAVYVPFCTSARKISECTMSKRMMASWRTAYEAALSVAESREFFSKLSRNGYPYSQHRA